MRQSTSTALLALAATGLVQLAAGAAINARGGCQMAGAHPNPPKQETNTGLCLPQGQGQWTFSLYDELTGTGLPTSDNGDPNGEYGNVSSPLGFTTG